MSAIGPCGVVPFGWIGSGGGSGGGSGSLTMFSAVVGDPGDPVAGTTTWVPGAPIAGASEMLLILIDKVPNQSIGSAPDFSWDGTTLALLGGNVWPPNGSTVIGWYVAP